MRLASVITMSEVAVLEVPQWQGSSSATAPRLAVGARSLAELLPISHRVCIPADRRPETAKVTAGVRHLDVLAENLRSVREALAQLEAPAVVTVGGDCGVELGPIEQASRRHGNRLAVVWFDAHGDLNTPEASPSGAFHGMVLRTLLGEGPAAMNPARPLAATQVVLAGARALDPAERRFIEHRGICHLGVDELAEPSALVEAVAAAGADRVYVHIDLDVLDPKEFSSVGLPEPNGLSPHQLARAIHALGEHFVIAGVGITEHQPAGLDETAVLEQLARTLTDVLAPTDQDDIQRIERHAIDAWPAPISQEFHGWLVRHTPGMQRLRSGNAALPLSHDRDLHSALSDMEGFYRRRGQPATVQVSPALAYIEIDEHLAELGYRLIVPVYVLTAPTEAVARLPKPSERWTVTVSETPTAAWLKAFVELDGHLDSTVLADHVISKLVLPAAYLTVTTDDHIAGTGLFVGGDARWAGIYCMATHPDHRRQGVALAVLRTGAHWAADHDISRLYLQVASANAAARNLYARAGFTYAYSYHYRQQETAAPEVVVHTRRQSQASH